MIKIYKKEELAASVCMDSEAIDIIEEWIIFYNVRLTQPIFNAVAEAYRMLRYNKSAYADPSLDIGAYLKKALYSYGNPYEDRVELLGKLLGLASCNEPFVWGDETIDQRLSMVFAVITEPKVPQLTSKGHILSGWSYFFDEMFGPLSVSYTLISDVEDEDVGALICKFGAKINPDQIVTPWSKKTAEAICSMVEKFSCINWEFFTQNYMGNNVLNEIWTSPDPHGVCGLIAEMVNEGLTLSPSESESQGFVYNDHCLDRAIRVCDMIQGLSIDEQVEHLSHLSPATLNWVLCQLAHQLDEDQLLVSRRFDLARCDEERFMSFVEELMESAQEICASTPGRKIFASGRASLEYGVVLLLKMKPGKNVSLYCPSDSWTVLLQNGKRWATRAYHEVEKQDEANAAPVDMSIAGFAVIPGAIHAGVTAYARRFGVPLYAIINDKVDLSQQVII